MPKYLVVIITLSGLANVSAQERDAIETVVVTASRTPIAITDSGSSISVITRQDLERRQMIQVTEILRNVPGIAVSQSGPLGSQTQVRLRGSEANHFLVLIDGVEANDPAFGDEFQFENLTTDNIERIEIVRGPQSALWGSDAVGGVINVTTRRGRTARETTGYLEAGSFATRRAGGRLSVARDTYTIDFGAAYLNSDGDNISRQGDETDGYSNRTLNFSGSVRPSEVTQLEFFARHTDSEKQFDAIDFFETGLPIDADRSAEATQSYLAATALISPAGSLLNHQFRLTYLDTAQDSLSDGVEMSGFGADKLGFYYQTTLPLGDSEAYSLTAALDHEREDFVQRGTANPFGDPNQTQKLDTTGYVLEYRAAPTDALNLSAAIRHDDSSAYDAASTYRLTASYALRKTRLRTSIGTGQKSPTFGDRFGFFPDTFIGNPDLKPERSRGWEVGVERALGDRATLSATYFNETLEDEINGFVFDPTTFQFTAANVSGRSERQGVELAASAELSRSVDFSASYSYTDSTQADDSGNQVDEIRRPQNVGAFNVNYVANERVNVNVNVAYNGSQYDTFFPPFPPSPERQKLASYTLVTIAASYQMTPRLELFGRIVNALNEDYEDVFGFNTPGIGVFIGLRAQQ